MQLIIFIKAVQLTQDSEEFYKPQKREIPRCLITLAADQPQTLMACNKACLNIATVYCKINFKKKMWIYI